MKAAGDVDEVKAIMGDTKSSPAEDAKNELNLPMPLEGSGAVAYFCGVLNLKANMQSL